MAVTTVDGHEFDISDAHDRVGEDQLIELAYVAGGMADSMDTSVRGRITEQAYRDLADAATRLRVIRHGNDRIRERLNKPPADG